MRFSRGRNNRIRVKSGPSDTIASHRTLVRISEAGWREGDAGLKAALGNCEGWTGMLCALKAYIEHGINLREGLYK